MWKWTKKDEGRAATALADGPAMEESMTPVDALAAEPEAESPPAEPERDTMRMNVPNGGAFVAKSIQDWMREGEELYNSAFKEFQQLEGELADLEGRLAAKQAEVNQIAGIIGKPPVEGNRRLSAQLVDERGPASVPNSSATIARALAGRQINR